MPVLSPHRSTASSGLSGSYRSTFSSSLDRPYGGYGGSAYTVTPRISSYSERYSSRSYTDSNGRSFYSRAGSITEDGYTSRYREESSREGSSRRESSTRAIDTLLESPSRRSLSTTGSDLNNSTSSLSSSSRGSTLNVVDSIADLRNKYSASNYVPAVIRNREHVSRSRTTSDIGLPPTTNSNNAAYDTVKNKKVTDANNLNNAATNNTNIDGEPDVDNMRQQDDNGNRPTVSVLEMTRKFEKRCANTPVNHQHSTTPSSTCSATSSTTQTRRSSVRSTQSVRNSDVAAALTVVSLSAPLGAAGTRAATKAHKSGHATNTSTATTATTTTASLAAASAAAPTTTTAAGARLNHSNHTNDFASYIPVESADKQSDFGESKHGKLHTVENGDMDRFNTNNTQKTKKSNKDVNSTSPRLNRSPIATNANGTSGALGGGSSSNRNSLERDGSHTRQMGGASSAAYDSSSSSSSTMSAVPHHISYDRSSPTKQMGLNGLKNIGNTCFMNSVIQCLSNTRPLLEYVRKEGYANDINTSLSSMKGALIKAFAQVIKELWSEDCSDRVVNTVSLKSQIQRFAPRFMGYSQQDAQEFLRYLLEGLHEDVNRVTSKPTPIHTEIDEKLNDHDKASESWQRYLRRENSKIVDLFVGQFKSTLKCTHCGHCSVTFDPFWDLSLPIPQKTGAIRLSQCLDSFTREETLDGDEKPTCAKCKERRKCTKSFTVHKFPKILVIHLKRFSPTERFRGKLSVTVDFPLEGLDMSGYASESNLHCRYNLYSVSNHSGTTYSGHYTAYCRHPYSTSWHEYNDSRVSSISSKSIVSGEAYVLFYELDGKISAHL